MLRSFTCLNIILLFTNYAAAQPTSNEAATQIDRQLQEEIVTASAAGLAPRTDDATFLRRAFLDLLGELPSEEDTLAFLLDDEPTKREKLLDGLLEDPAFGLHWGRYWRDVILYRRTEPRAILSSDALTQFLKAEINAGTSWDSLARHFITANGDVKQNGATGLIMAHGGRPEETVAELSRIFMGIQIQCAQCHDHPTDRWKREQFHQLAAFFPRVAIRPQRNGNDRTFLVEGRDTFPRRRRMNNNRYIGTAEHRMPDLEHPEQPGALTQPIFFVNGNQLGLGADDTLRRKQLAQWMTSTENPWFAAAVVNRLWAQLVGQGFYEPVDDLGPDRQCTAPQTLNYLVSTFQANDHDLKWLFRTIMSTVAYQRESRSQPATETAAFLANRPQRLRADTLFNTLSGSLGIPERLQRNNGRTRNGARRLFNSTFGYDPSLSRDSISGSVQQSLMMMNSQLVNNAIQAKPGTQLGRLLRQIQDNRRLLLALYLRTLARQPTPTEEKTCLGYVRESSSREEAFEDILWSLVNSTEFLHRN